MDRAVGPQWPIVQTNLFSIDHLNSLPWSPFRKGIEISWLFRTDQGPSSAFLRYVPGASLERHVHPGHEHILILQGSQTDDAGVHPAGTLVIHGPGTSHAISSPGGCIVLAMWEKPVHLS